jgi:DNA helicase-2/ATP-dependent DNA helicase PcrA
MYVTKDVYEIYNWLLEDYGWPTLPEVPVERRVLEYEDVFPILYLKYRLSAGMKKRNIRHLVIDEMQDYSYLQYVILQYLFNCNMTILGDKAQTVDDKLQDVLRFLPRIFGKDVRRIEMKKSYRNTAEIAEYAKSLTEVKGIEYVNRHGKAVEELSGYSLTEAADKILDIIGSGNESYETMAVLTMTEDEAREIYEHIRKIREDVSYIDRDSSVFRKGITVTTYYMAKGLEFDQVFVAGGEKHNPFYKQFQYISATRALHELYIFE